jgi:hypothetical protein
MCQSGVTCLFADCCFSELSLWKSNYACWSSTKQISSSSHWKLTCSRHDIAEKLLCGVGQQSLKHSLKWWGNHIGEWLVCFMVFHATFNNISVISWWSVLLVEETGGGPEENHWPVVSHWQTWSHNVVHLALIEIQAHNISGDRLIYN